jgi:hypothetical protein
VLTKVRVVARRDDRPGCKVVVEDRVVDAKEAEDGKVDDVVESGRGMSAGSLAEGSVLEAASDSVSLEVGGADSGAT